MYVMVNESHVKLSNAQRSQLLGMLQAYEQADMLECAARDDLVMVMHKLRGPIAVLGNGERLVLWSILSEQADALGYGPFTDLETLCSPA